MPLARLNAFGINQAGRVVGVSVDLTGIHGFLYRSGDFSSIDVPGNSGGTEAFGINERGEIAGLYFTDSGRTAHGFIDRGGNFTTIDFPSAAQTQLNGINGSGQIVGLYLETDQSLPHGFLCDDGVFQLIDPPDAISSGAFDVNNRGEIVGDYTDARGTHGFLDTRGTFQTIDVPGFEGRTFTRGIDQKGDIVGSIREEATGHSHGYLRTSPTILRLRSPQSRPHSFEEAAAMMPPPCHRSGSTRTPSARRLEHVPGGAAAVRFRSGGTGIRLYARSAGRFSVWLATSNGAGMGRS